MGAPRRADPAVDRPFGLSAGAGRPKRAAGPQNALRRMLSVEESPRSWTAPTKPPETTAPLASKPGQRPGWDWAAANQRKKAAITALAPLIDILDDIDARINELLAAPNSWRTSDGVAAQPSEGA